MSEWKKVKLGDYCEITSSKRCLASVRSKNGIPFFCSKEIICLDKGEDFEPTDFIPEELYNDIKAKYGVPTSGDLLLTTRGTNGIPYIYKPSDKFYFADGNLSWFKNFGKELSPQYLYYWFKSPLGIHEVDAISKGTAQKAVPIDGLRRIVLLTPSLHTQNRIVVILSRYDSLIENYQKQIKLLEEAAQRLYKEWFIDLHFPGHENTKIVDGVPEGWERKKVGEIGTVITGKTPSTSNKENYGGSIPFITIPDMHTGIYPVSSVFLSEKGAESQSKKYIPQGALIVSCIGTAGLVCITKERCQTNQQINSLILDDKEMLHYMYFVFLSLKEHLNNIGSNGATMTNVNKSKFEGIDIVVPSSCIIRDFSQRTTPYFENILSLQSQIRLLTEARDRLLPKLMSGEITV